MPIEHRGPTPGTAKYLYAHALSCAYQGCNGPLYRVDGVGQGRILNSRIAHICARSEGGPRWDADMSEAENRSASNLIVMCLIHADEIDNPSLVDRYSVDTLRQWKQAQLDAYDEAVSKATAGEEVGWTLSDEEAAQVIRLSESGTNITIEGHTIHIGGGGGQFGGAGGGGGAVGQGVLIAGPGGDATKIILEGGAGEFPGSGCGGGGSIAPNTIERPPGRRGTEGACHFVGVDGEAGGDTVFKSGDLEIRAHGGKAGLSGSGNRVMSDRLAVSTLLLVNYAEILPNCLVAAVGAGWQNISVLNLGDQAHFPVFAIIELGGVDEGEYTLVFELRNPSGEQRSRISLAVAVERLGDVLRLPVVLNLSAAVDEFGIWHLTVGSDVQALAALDVMVKRVGEVEPT